MSNKQKAKKTEPTQKETPTVVILDQPKFEYDRLISYFKYLVTITMGAIAIVVGVVVYFTYKDAKEFKAELKEKEEKLESILNGEKNKMKEDIREIKEKYKETENEFKAEVRATKTDAVNQISIIKGEAIQTAKTAANDEIEKTFRDNNIDSFIVKVAKKHMDPQVTKAILDERDRKIEDAIFKMEGSDIYEMNIASLLLNTNLQYPLKQIHIDKLIELCKSNKNVFMNPYICSALSYQKNNSKVTEFFEYIIVRENEDPDCKGIAKRYLDAVKQIKLNKQ
ncbi:MAG: hypothetical protein ABIP51_03435 [Bacteroidia bacterium]